MSQTPTAEPAALPAPVTAHSAYTLAQLARACGVCSKTLRKWREDGLKFRQVGQRKFVLGSDFLQFLAER